MCRRQLLLQVAVQLLLATLVCSDGQSGSTTPDAAFRLTRVTKTRPGGYASGEIYLIRLEYQTSCQPEVLLRKTPGAVAEVFERVVEGQAATELTLSACHGDAEVIFWCSANELPFIVKLNLRGTPDLMDIPDIDVNAAQGSDVTFQAGSPVQLDFTFDIGGDEDAITSGDLDYLSLQFRSEDTSRVEISTFYPGDAEADGQTGVWLKPLSFGGAQTHQTASLRIESSFPDPEGTILFLVDVRFNCVHNCLVRKYSTPYRVNIYRQDHSGPFPEDFLTFVDVGYLHSAVSWSKSKSSVHCYASPVDDSSYSSDCILYCEARGSLPSTMTLSRVTPIGLQPVDALSLSAGNWSTAQLRTDDVTARDGGVYRCTATAAGGRSITKDLTLVVRGRN